MVCTIAMGINFGNISNWCVCLFPLRFSSNSRNSIIVIIHASNLAAERIIDSISSPPLKCSSSSACFLLFISLMYSDLYRGVVSKHPVLLFPTDFLFPLIISLRMFLQFIYFVQTWQPAHYLVEFHRDGSSLVHRFSGIWGPTHRLILLFSGWCCFFQLPIAKILLIGAPPPPAHVILIRRRWCSISLCFASLTQMLLRLRSDIFFVTIFENSQSYFRKMIWHSRPTRFL